MIRLLSITFVNAKNNNITKSVICQEAIIIFPKYDSIGLVVIENQFI